MPLVRRMRFGEGITLRDRTTGAALWEGTYARKPEGTMELVHPLCALRHGSNRSLTFLCGQGVVVDCDRGRPQGLAGAIQAARGGR